MMPTRKLPTAAIAVAVVLVVLGAVLMARPSITKIVATQPTPTPRPIPTIYKPSEPHTPEEIQAQAAFLAVWEQLAADYPNIDDFLAGVAIHYEPEFRILINYTGEGREIISTYLEGKSWYDDVVFTEVQWTRTQLNEATHRANEILDGTGYYMGTAVVNGPQNHVQVQVHNEKVRNTVLDLLEGEPYFHMLEFTCCTEVIHVDVPVETVIITIPGAPRGD